MSDGQEKKRPNANYKLSNENVSTDGIVYHYNRERRLEKAPQAVRDLYKAEPLHRFNFLRPLVRTRPLAMMFATVVVASLLIMIISVLGLASNSRNLDGNQVSVQAIRYEGATIMIVRKTVRKSVLGRRVSNLAPAYSGAVDIAVQPVLTPGAGQESPPEDIFYHKIFFTFEPEESYRFTVPFEAGELALVLKTEKKTLGLTVKTE